MTPEGSALERPEDRTLLETTLEHDEYYFFSVVTDDRPERSYDLARSIASRDGRIAPDTISRFAYPAFQALRSDDTILRHVYYDEEFDNLAVFLSYFRLESIIDINGFGRTICALGANPAGRTLTILPHALYIPEELGSYVTTDEQLPDILDLILERVPIIPY